MKLIAIGIAILAMSQPAGAQETAEKKAACLKKAGLPANFGKNDKYPDAKTKAIYYACLGRKNSSGKTASVGTSVSADKH